MRPDSTAAVCAAPLSGIPITTPSTHPTAHEFRRPAMLSSPQRLRIAMTRELRAARVPRNRRVVGPESSEPLRRAAVRACCAASHSRWWGQGPGWDAKGSGCGSNAGATGFARRVREPVALRLEAGVGRAFAAVDVALATRPSHSLHQRHRSRMPAAFRGGRRGESEAGRVGNEQAVRGAEPGVVGDTDSCTRHLIERFGAASARHVSRRAWRPGHDHWHQDHAHSPRASPARCALAQSGCSHLCRSDVQGEHRRTTTAAPPLAAARTHARNRDGRERFLSLDSSYS